MSNPVTASQRQCTQLKKLARRKNRHELGLFLAEGTRTVSQLIEQGKVHIRELYVLHDVVYDEDIQRSGVPMYYISSKEMNELSGTESPQGLLALCEIPPIDNLNDWKERTGFILAFDRIQDPGNLGTLIRTASWFGMDALLFSGGTADQWNPKVVRSTAGATGALPYMFQDLSIALQTLSDGGWRPVLLDGNPGSTDLDDWQPGNRTILVVGNEAQGIDPELVERYERVRISGNSSQTGAESLNAAIAASIAMYVLHQKA